MVWKQTHIKGFLKQNSLNNLLCIAQLNGFLIFKRVVWMLAWTVDAPIVVITLQYSLKCMYNNKITCN